MLSSPIALRLVSGPSAWSRVSAGMSHTCETRFQGAEMISPVYCSGNNTSDQAGQAGMSAVLSPLVVDGTQTKFIRGLASGDDFTCGLDVSISPYQTLCWGANDRGQLGNGAASSPTPVPTPVVFP